MSLVIDSQESGGTAHHSATSPLNYSFNNAAGTLFILGIGVNGTAGGPPAVSAVTYGGASMSLVKSVFYDLSGNDLCGVWLYAIENPATGSNTVSVTWSDPSGGTVDSIAAGISFRGEQSGSFTAQSGSNSTASVSTPATVTLSGTQTGNYVVSVATAGSSWSSAVSPTTQSAVLNNSGTTAGDNFIFGYQTAGGSQTASYNISGADLWGIVAMEIQASSATLMPQICM